MASEVRLKFLGTRSLFCSLKKENLEFGGNTECLTISDKDHLFLIHGGFAINPLGEDLQKQALHANAAQQSRIFLTDFLWEHLLGIPFYSPIHFKNNHIHFHTPLNELNAKEWLNRTCKLDFSPFNGFSSLRSKIELHDPQLKINIGNWEIEPILTTSPLTPYPVAIWTFKHQSGVKIAVSAHKISEKSEQIRIAKLLEGYTYVIQSAISPNTEEPTAVGRWTFKEAAEFGSSIHSQKFFIQGYHPKYTDQELKSFEAQIQKDSTAITFAREDLEIEVNDPLVLTKAS